MSMIRLFNFDKKYVIFFIENLIFRIKIFQFSFLKKFNIKMLTRDYLCFFFLILIFLINYLIKKSRIDIKTQNKNLPIKIS